MELEPSQSPIKPPLRVRAKVFTGLFLEGMRSPWSGLRFLLRHRALWQFALLPLLINLAATLLVLLSVGILGVEIALWFHRLPYFSAGAWTRVQEALADLLLLAALLGVAAATYLLVGGILSSYFNERLARQVEIVLGAAPAELTVAPFPQHVADAMRGFAVVASTTLGCFMLGCIPLVGFVAGAISFYVDWFVFGYEFFEMPLTLRGVPRGEKRALARKHRPRVLGIGATVFLMNLVPLLGSVLLTTAAVGAVLLHRKINEPSKADVTPAGG